jgi:hypothetical protein
MTEPTRLFRVSVDFYVEALGLNLASVVAVNAAEAAMMEAGGSIYGYELAETARATAGEIARLVASGDGEEDDDDD